MSWREGVSVATARGYEGSYLVVTVALSVFMTFKPLARGVLLIAWCSANAIRVLAQVLQTSTPYRA